MSSLDPKRLTTEQWLLLVRSHWGVENQNHHTLDTAFEEDDRPWIEADANGMLAVLLLRRIAYTLLALYRAVTLCSERGRATPWKALLPSVRDVPIAAGEEQLAGLRLREVTAATRFQSTQPAATQAGKPKPANLQTDHVCPLIEGRRSGPGRARGPRPGPGARVAAGVRAGYEGGAARGPLPSPGAPRGVAMERHQQDPELAELVRRTEEANAALLNGQIDRYVALTPHAEDFTLMPPFGGVTRGFDTSPERQAAMARFFRSGAGALEVVQAHASGDLAFLAVIERQRAAVADLPEQDWSLRVTLVFRREGAGWRLLHRHADPLVQGRDVAQTAALARR